MADCLLGYSAAQKLGLKEGDALTILGNKLKVAKVLTETGTIDDDRVFAHLKTVQDILGIHDQVSAIEIMGCCNAISDGLLGQLRNILPDTRITTIGQIVSTQIKTNQLMNQISLIILIIILIVGGISIGNYMWANVNERKKEIGILRMIGFPRSSIYSMLLIKAVFMGLVGGTIGYLAGALIAWFLGPALSGINVPPIPVLLLYSVLLAGGIAVLGSILPAYFASRFEPYSNMQEI